MKLGCHAVLFRERIASETPTILRGLASTGFEGIELGARFFGTERQEYLSAELKAAGLQIAALHVGVPTALWAEDPTKATDAVLGAARFIKGIPGVNLNMSGAPCENLVDVARGINRAAEECAALGVRLHYHNHAAEFLNGAAMYKALREHAPSLLFGFDLGWVQKAGYNLYQVLEENPGRVDYLHLRDFDGIGVPREDDPEYAAYTGGAISHEFPDIGTGKVDFSRLIPYLKDYLPPDGWAVVEYETGEQDFARYAKARAYLGQWL